MSYVNKKQITERLNRDVPEHDDSEAIAKQLMFETGYALDWRDYEYWLENGDTNTMFHRACRKFIGKKRYDQLLQLNAECLLSLPEVLAARLGIEGYTDVGVCNECGATMHPDECGTTPADELYCDECADSHQYDRKHVKRLIDAATTVERELNYNIRSGVLGSTWTSLQCDLKDALDAINIQQ